jgi:hypothetical protein
VSIIDEDVEEIGAAELAEQGEYLVVSLTAGGVRIQRDGVSAVGEPADLDLHHARHLYTVLGRAIEQASKEGAVSTLVASERAYQLADAIAEMATRYGDARSRRAEEFAWYLRNKASGRGEMDRWEQATRRRYRALLRLTAALRDLPMKEQT